MEKTLKEQLLKFIERERFINKAILDTSSDGDCLMSQLISGKEVVLKRLEELIQKSP